MMQRPPSIIRRILKNTASAYGMAAVVFTAALLATSPQAGAQSPANARPTLLITNDPVPAEIRENIYSKPARVRDIRPQELTGQNYFSPTETVVTRRVRELQGELGQIQNRTISLSQMLNGLQRDNEIRAANYYAAVATINTQLQSGTTPGNPRLLARVTQAEQSLEDFNGSVAALNQLALDTAAMASAGSYLLESTRAAYTLSGAVEEDHVLLAGLEDSINSTLVAIERLLNTINDDLVRTSTYLSSERNNLRTLALAVANGDLYGKSLANRPFSSVGAYNVVSMAQTASAVPPVPVQQQALAAPRPLAKIRFDTPNVNYEQPLYVAVNEALERFPDARFDLVAIQPAQGNAARRAIESTRARRNAEKVLRTLTQLGLPLDRINLSYQDSEETAVNEVHLFVR